MDWKDLLISIYVHVCDEFNAGLYMYSQRHSNNAASLALSFTDQEAISVYVFGLLKKRGNVRQIYDYTADHLLEWFPDLPSYQKFNERINRLTPVLIALAQGLAARINPPDFLQGQALVDTVVDSFPIIMAKASRADSAKVARQVVDKGHCASKKLWYHGVKLHQLAICRPGRLPLPVCLVMSAASENDNTVFKQQIAPYFKNIRVYADKIFDDQPASRALKEQLNIEVMAANKRKKGQQYLHADQKLFNTLVSKARQPIESFFNWLEEKTAIQCAAKVRSMQGLFKHIFGRIAAALFSILF